MQTAFIIVTIGSALFWLSQLISLILSAKKIPKLADLNYADLETFPLISVIITACNEADTIEAAVNSRLEDDYPALEFLLVDDRSTDGTSEIVDKIAARDSRVKAIHISQLPDGWLGKVHALHRAVQEASGDWFLFSDADVHVKPGTLKQLIARCETEDFDHTAVIPEFHSAGLLVDSAVSVLLRALIAFGRLYDMENKKSNVSGGAGAFNLVRRSAFEKTKGFPWLRLEIIDDVTLGQMLKTAGAGATAVNGKGFVGLCWYPTFRDALEGMGRAMTAALGNYSVLRLVPFSTVGFVFDMAVFAALFPLGIPYLPYLGLFGVTVAVAAAITANRILSLPILPGVLLPLGHILILFTALRGAVKLAVNKGIIWRGTLYHKKQLRRGRRFSYFPPKPGA
jgi:glycosyltransferase involved in cell wall biosynthesis